MGVLRRLQHEAFCLAYVASNNATEAYKSAYPDCKNDNTAGSAARRLLGNALVILRVKELKGEIAAAVVERVAFDEARVIDELAQIAFANVSGEPGWHEKLAALKILEERFRPKEAAGTTINNNIAFIDRPPEESYDEWIARQRRDGHGDPVRAVEAPARTTNGRHPRDVG